MMAKDPQKRDQREQGWVVNSGSLKIVKGPINALVREAAKLSAADSAARL